MWKTWAAAASLLVSQACGGPSSPADAGSERHDGAPDNDAGGPEPDGGRAVVDGGAVDAGAPRDARVDPPALTARGVSGRFEDDGTIVIDALPGESFGALGPRLWFYESFRGQAPGEPMRGESEAGDAPFEAGTTGFPEVVADDALPYGRGIRVGRGMGRALAVAPEPHAEFLDVHYIYFPNRYEPGESPWQIKPFWHFHSGDGYGAADDQDVFAGGPGWYTSGGYWVGARIGSNTVPTSTFDRGPHGLVDPDDRSRLRAAPMRRMLWVRGGDAAGSTAGSDGMYRNLTPDDGFVASADYGGSAVWWGDDVEHLAFDRMTFPGYVRGFTDDSWAVFGEVYQTIGPGAVARVELGDAERYEDCTRLAIVLVESQDDWTAERITARVRLGVFHSEGAEGLYLHVHDAENEHTNGGVGRLVAAP